MIQKREQKVELLVKRDHFSSSHRGSGKEIYHFFDVSSSSIADIHRGSNA